jgi:hemoglobin
MSDLLLHRCGGHRAVARIVMAFYDRVLQSPQVAPFFADVDMRRLVEHQTKFLAGVMGGPQAYANADLREAHAHLSIADHHFDEMVRLLGDALSASGMPEHDVAAVLADIDARRPWIVQQEPVG